MPAGIPPWARYLVALGRLRTTLLLTGVSVSASVAMVAVFAVIFQAERQDLPAYFIPAVLVPSVVAPAVIRILLDLLAALDIAHRQAAQQQKELERVQRLDLVGRLASGMAHDLNNLLTVVRASVEALGGPSAHPDLAAIDDAAQRGARLTQRMLAISLHDEVVVRTPQPLGPILDDVHAAVRHVLPSGVRLVMPASGPPILLNLDADAIHQALLNLLLNAKDAVAARGHIELTISEAEDGGWLVRVTDDGPGIPAELLAQVTEPFVTTKAAHQGAGLGLAMVKRTAEQHGGRLSLSSSEGVGTTAELWFPAHTAPSIRPTPEVLAKPPPPRPAKERRLLLVDDEDVVRRATARSLERLGYHVAMATDATEARAWLAEHEPVDVIVSDVMMPGATGVELLQTLRAGGDTTPVLLVSGYSTTRVEHVISTITNARFLAKPWTQRALAHELQALLHDGGRAPTPP